MNSTMTVFRVGKDGEVFALFPEEPTDLVGDFCSCYQHVGQHGSADYHKCIADSRPATPEEYKGLVRELVDIGYEIEVCSRVMPSVHAIRHEAAQNPDALRDLCRFPNGFDREARDTYGWLRHYGYHPEWRFSDVKGGRVTYIQVPSREFAGAKRTLQFYKHL